MPMLETSSLILYTLWTYLKADINIKGDCDIPTCVVLVYIQLQEMSLTVGPSNYTENIDLDGSYLTIWLDLKGPTHFEVLVFVKFTESNKANNLQGVMFSGYRQVTDDYFQPNCATIWHMSPKLVF